MPVSLAGRRVPSGRGCGLVHCWVGWCAGMGRSISIQRQPPAPDEHAPPALPLFRPQTLPIRNAKARNRPSAGPGRSVYGLDLLKQALAAGQPDVTGARERSSVF